MFGKKRRISSSKNKRRKPARPKRLSDLTWQLIGMITIIVILMTLAFGDSRQATSFASDNFLDKTFSEVIASFEIRPFWN